MKTDNTIRLPSPTNSTEQGPVVVYEKDNLKVKYDCNDNEKKWVEISFSEVLTYQFIQIACCQSEHIVDNNSIMVYDDTPFLLQARKIWEESVGWQDWQKKQGGASRFKLYRLYFDDEGCLDVIAAQCKVN
jgi:hypothetical protein